MLGTVKRKNLLSKVEEVQVSEVEFFSVKERLGAANVLLTGSNFDYFFLNNIEHNVQSDTLSVYRLEESSLDEPILDEIGGRATISLAHFFELIERQAKGQEGALLTNGGENIAYIVDRDSKIWTVSTCWYGLNYHHWGLGADVSKSQIECPKNSLIISPSFLYL